ncbi:L,D-transpeptidase family protein [Anaerotardibacter muris]|uniref:L,D-transpeptidase family protein n=1 Tax=Anaerotardibacter muris TaxID=2941505 RepID=UPI00204031B2|nr:L,D-transpeptidase family protein [Anaerotardibacter muris]
MSQNVEGSQRSFFSAAAGVILSALVALLCMGAATQFAYADESEGASSATTVLAEDDEDAAASATVDQDDNADAADLADSKTDTATSGTSGATTGSSTATENKPATETPAPAQAVKPEKKPTKAGWMQDTDGTWYYFANVNAKPATGWVKSGGKWYWMQPDKNGAMATNTWITDQGKRYYLNASGVMVKGWVKIGNDWYYTNKSGAQVTGGWIKSGRSWYWLQADKQGLMAKNEWITDKGKRYYLTGSGAMKTGWILMGNDWYYANKSGAQISSGWVKSGRSWYWMQSDKQGLMAKNEWITDKNKQYYLTGSGAMKTGWVQNGSDWYYTNKSGARVNNGWVKSGSKWYWLQGDKQGLMFANDFKTINNMKYSFASDGAMRANCKIDLGDNVVGYAAGSGAITRIGENRDGKLVLTNAAGQTLSGWQKLAGKWFYGEAGTGIAQTGWLKLGSTWYYFDSNAAMVTGTYTINGKANIFTASGKWIGADNMATKAQGYSSGTGYLILVDRSLHRVGVFSGSKGHWNRIMSFSCVTGAPGSPTITGTFRTTGMKRMTLSTDSRAHWCTQISGGYFFHTILASNSELGNSLSHGCLRLAVSDAQWIYNHIGAGTTVVIYN